MPLGMGPGHFTLWAPQRNDATSAKRRTRSLRCEEDARLLQRRGGGDHVGLVEDVVRRLQDLEALLELLVRAPEVREARDQQDLAAEPLLEVPERAREVVDAGRLLRGLGEREERDLSL